MDDLNKGWINESPSACEICKGNMPHLHYAVIIKGGKRFAQKFGVINGDVDSIESMSGFSHWMTEEEREDVSRELCELFKSMKGGHKSNG